MFGAQAVPLARLHGEILAFGAMPLIVCGFALRLLPRFAGTPPFRGLLPGAVLLPFAAGVTLRAIAAIAPIPGAAVAAAALAAIGGLVFATAVASVLRAGSRPRPDLVLFLLAALWLPAAGALDLSGARAAALDALLWGFVGGHILAVFSRTAPAFIAARPPGVAGLAIAGTLWHLGIAAAVLGVLPGWSAALAGALAIVITTRLYGTGIARGPIQPGAQLTRTALRLAFGWLLVALALLSLRAIEATFDVFTPIDTGAARHALTLGFILPVIYAYGSRLVPTLTGGPPPHLRSVTAIVTLANVGVFMRVLADIFATDPAAVVAAVGSSAIAAAAALLLFVALTVRTLRRGGLPIV